MPSKAYNRALEEAKRHHAGSKTYSGLFLRPQKAFLLDLIARLGIKSALDYGCGKGEQYRWVDPRDGKTLEEAFGFEVTKYDPAWPPYAAEPQGSFDLVICTHVLGSIPIPDLPWAIGRLHDLATKAVFIAERIGPPKKKVFSRPEEHPLQWNSMQWLDAIHPHTRDGVETHLSARYRNAQGFTFTGRFVVRALVGDGALK